MLAFFVRLLRIQKDIYDSLRNRRLTGEIAADATPEMQLAPGLLTMTVSTGPPALRERAERLQSNAPFEEIALPFWHKPSDHDFFGKVLVQPYLERLAAQRVRPRYRDHLRGERRCPFCGGAPVSSSMASVVSLRHR